MKCTTNNVGTVKGWGFEHLSIGLHAHRNDLVLTTVQGDFKNIVAIPTDEGDTRLRRFRYQSRILTDRIGFFEDGIDTFDIEAQVIPAGCSIDMPAERIHTVFVTYQQEAAWLVFEGKENPDHKDYTWTNHDLSKATFDDMYTKMNEDQIHKILNRVVPWI